jgi:class 3 adenylate cyclase
VAERRVCSVLFCDAVGFTPLSESRDPEAVRELLSALLNLSAALIDTDPAAGAQAAGTAAGHLRRAGARDMLGWAVANLAAALQRLGDWDVPRPNLPRPQTPTSWQISRTLAVGWPCWRRCAATPGPQSPSW